MKSTVKLILVGSHNVGKTSLVGAFFNQHFEVQTISTVAPAYCGSTLDIGDNRKVELQTWDTAGQEQYQSISQMFYRDAQVAFICFDPQSLDSIDQWVQRVIKAVPECRLILVVTKVDTLSEDEIVTITKQCSELRETYGAEDVFLTSAKTKTGVKEVFRAAAEIGYMQQQPLKANVELKDSQREKKGCC